MTKKHPEDLSLFLDSISARTCRHLAFMKALFEIDDPELEQALTVIVERLAAAGSRTSGNGSPSPDPKGQRRRKLPQAS